MITLKTINIYANGISGFIGAALKNYIKNNYGYINVNKNNRIKVIFHEVPRRLSEFETYDGIFLQIASPSDSEDFKKELEMERSMIDDVLHNIEICKNQKDIVFGFFSSVAVEEIELNRYGRNKLFIESRLMMEALTDQRDKKLDSVIFRVPRVYGQQRPKGLMKKLREDKVREEDYSKVINFMDIHPFIVEFVNYLKDLIMEKETNINCIKEFPNTKQMTIKEIKDYYKL